MTLTALPELFARLRRKIILRQRYPFVANANRADERHFRGYVLLEYLPKAFLFEADHPAFRQHQNLRRCQLMAAGLGELGYGVDVGSRGNRRFRPARDYDLIISERQDWQGIEPVFRPDAIKVFLATAMNHRVHNANLRRRHARLAERRGCDVQLRRVFKEHLPALPSYAALVGPGNEHTLGVWRQAFAGPIYPFDNFGYRQTAAPPVETKDFDRARRHFLFFASRSQVQKGLDLLLEIFPRLPDLHLHVCSDFAAEADFCACYRKELFETPNIHPVGWTLVNSPQYDELIAQCACVVYPTCSDGQAGSVVQCMVSGLMPLVTREAGLDTAGFGLTFADDSLETVARGIREVAQQPPEWHRQRSLETRRVAEQHYSEEAFLRRWRSIIAGITGLPKAP